MAQIVFTAAERDKLKSTLAGVKSNAQAQAAVNSVLVMADKLVPLLRSEGGAYREQAAKDIAEYAKRVRDHGAALAGSPTLPVGATWAEVSRHVSDLYYLVRTIEQGCPPDEDLGDGFRSAMKSSLADLPANVSAAATVVVAATKKVANSAVKTVKAVTTGAAEIVGGTAWALLKPLMPVLLLVGVGVGIFFYVEKKGLPLPKGLP